MHIENLSHWSGHLNREMYLNRYGHAGIPVVVFASSGGSHNEYYDFGMIDACASFIEEGRVQFFTLSSVDSESWLATWKNSHDQAEMHRAYERYVIEEAIPFYQAQDRMVRWHDDDRLLDGRLSCTQFLSPASRCLYQGDCSQWCLRCTFLCRRLLQ